MAQYAQLLEQLQSLRQNPPQDAESQRVLFNALRSSTFAVERPIDTVHRVAFTVRHFIRDHSQQEADRAMRLQSLQSTVTRIAIDLKLFNILKDSNEAKSVQQIARLSGADELLLRRRLAKLLQLILL